jgi:hypothetical protein
VWDWKSDILYIIFDRVQYVSTKQILLYVWSVERKNMGMNTSN